MTYDADPDDAVSRERSLLEDPPPLERLDARILAAYRREFVPRRRSWPGSLRVPLPLAAAVLAALLACAALLVRGRAGSASATVPSPPEAEVPARHDRPLVTNTSLAGFEPVDDMQLVLVGEGVKKGRTP
jgi:hypothetical protein